MKLRQDLERLVPHPLDGMEGVAAGLMKADRAGAAPAATGA